MTAILYAHPTTTTSPLRIQSLERATGLRVVPGHQVALLVPAPANNPPANQSASSQA